MSARLRGAALSLAAVLSLALVAWLLRDAREGFAVGCFWLGWVAVALAVWRAVGQWLCGPARPEGGAS